MCVGITVRVKDVDFGRLSFFCFAISSVKVASVFTELRRESALCKLAAKNGFENTC